MKRLAFRARTASPAHRSGFSAHRIALGASIGVAAALLVGCAFATATSGANSPAAPRAASSSAGSVAPSGVDSGTEAPGISSVAHSGRHWKIGFDLAPAKVVVAGPSHRVLCGTGSSRATRCSSTVAFTHSAKCVTVRSVWANPAVTTQSRIGSACIRPSSSGR